jgi:hypothetical protein
LECFLVRLSGGKLIATVKAKVAINPIDLVFAKCQLIFNILTVVPNQLGLTPQRLKLSLHPMQPHLRYK